MRVDAAVKIEKQLTSHPGDNKKQGMCGGRQEDDSQGERCVQGVCEDDT